MYSTMNADAMKAAAVPAGSLSGIVALDAERRRLPPELLSAYLERLGVNADAVQEQTLDTLELLQSAHCDRIAYENLDIHAAIGGGPLALPGLDPSTSAQRVAVGLRGGCTHACRDSLDSLGHAPPCMPPVVADPQKCGSNLELGRLFPRGGCLCGALVHPRLLMLVSHGRCRRGSTPAREDG